MWQILFGLGTAVATFVAASRPPRPPRPPEGDGARFIRDALESRPARYADAMAVLAPTELIARGFINQCDAEMARQLGRGTVSPTTPGLTAKIAGHFMDLVRHRGADRYAHAVQRAYHRTYTLAELEALARAQRLIDRAEEKERAVQARALRIADALHDELYAEAVRRVAAGASREFWALAGVERRSPAGVALATRLWSPPTMDPRLPWVPRLSRESRRDRYEKAIRRLVPVNHGKKYDTGKVFFRRVREQVTARRRRPGDDRPARGVLREFLMLVRYRGAPLYVAQVRAAWAKTYTLADLEALVDAARRIDRGPAKRTRVVAWIELSRKEITAGLMAEAFEAWRGPAAVYLAYPEPTPSEIEKAAEARAEKEGREEKPRKKKGNRPDRREYDDDEPRIRRLPRSRQAERDAAWREAQRDQPIDLGDQDAG